MSESTIVTCECGAKVRLPADAGSRTLRCPRCKARIALTVDARVLVSSQLQPGDPGATCPICQTNVGSDDFVVTCLQCQQVHHRECWSEVGGCSTYGCSQAPAVDKSNAAAAQPRSAWGDEKTCPACGETIKSIALRCRYCGTDFDSVDPMSVHDLHRQARTAESLANLKKATVALFAGSLCGLLAPITGLVGLFVLLPRRNELRKCGPLYQVLGYSSLGLSAVFSLAMLLFLVFS